MAPNVPRGFKLQGSYVENPEDPDGQVLNTTDASLSLGFTRSLSAHIYLPLEGELTEVQVNGIPQPGMTDQRAQAKLALRF